MNILLTFRFSKIWKLISLNRFKENLIRSLLLIYLNHPCGIRTIMIHCSAFISLMRPQISFSSWRIWLKTWRLSSRIKLKLSNSWRLFENLISHKRSTLILWPLLSKRLPTRMEVGMHFLWPNLWQKSLRISRSKSKLVLPKILPKRKLTQRSKECSGLTTAKLSSLLPQRSKKLLPMPFKIPSASCRLVKSRIKRSWTFGTSLFRLMIKSNTDSTLWMPNFLMSNMRLLKWRGSSLSSEICWSTKKSQPSNSGIRLSLRKDWVCSLCPELSGINSRRIIKFKIEIIWKN